MDNPTWSDIFSSNDVSLIVGKQQMEGFVNDLGNEKDESGFLIDSNDKKRVISQDEDEIKLKELGSISSGSKIFIKDNLASYAEFLAQKRSL
ncbi:MAG: hypothetical protein KJ600_04270 [Nanoarchaeota archaeon]|nr:hypothetical protein [Nanoarchaeota archaeon]MBU1103743.1 hypothetical protein [Nanoarchaeota archaeon]